MANPFITVDPLDELRLMTPIVPDRLPAMLFLAALVHGILIIGVTFNAALTDPFADAISLEVTIVADPDQQIDRPDEAAYLAQRLTRIACDMPLAFTLDDLKRRAPDVPALESFYERARFGPMLGKQAHRLAKALA